MNLPKWLVQKLGKDQVSSLVVNGVPISIYDKQRINNENKLYKSHRCPSSGSKLESKKRWREKQVGKLPEDELFSVEDALEKAGL